MLDTSIRAGSWRRPHNATASHSSAQLHWNVDHWPEGFKLVLIAPDDLIVEVGNVLGTDSDRQRVLELARCLEIPPLKTRIVVEIKDGVLKRTTFEPLRIVEAVLPLPRIAPLVLFIAAGRYRSEE